jgi:hypothetical protein
MSIFTDLLKSGASSVAGAVSEKIGIDPATAQGFVDQALPGNQAEAAAADPAQQDVAPAEEAAATDAAAPEAEGLLDQASAMLGGSQGIMDKAKGLLDQDGDGNPLNDITGMVGKMFGKS